MKRLAALALLALGLAASSCAHTGSTRCDRVLVGQATILESKGWRLDCTPGFSNYSAGEGRYVAAWTDRSHRTVWIWPGYGNMTDDRVLQKVAQHELGHVLFGDSEQTAEWFSYCTLFQPGVGYVAPLPTAADCARF